MKKMTLFSYTFFYTISYIVLFNRLYYIYSGVFYSNSNNISIALIDILIAIIISILFFLSYSLLNKKTLITHTLNIIIYGLLSTLIAKIFYTHYPIIDFVLPMTLLYVPTYILINFKFK